MIRRTGLALVLLILVLAHLGLAATPVFDASQTATGTTVSSLTWTQMVGAGCVSPILFVGAVLSGGTTATVSSVTVNGVPMTAVGGAVGGSGFELRVDLRRMVAPPQGSALTIVATYSGTNPGDAFGVSESYCNVHQTTPLGTPVTGSSSTGTPSIVVGSAAGELVIDMVAIGWPPPTAGSGQVIRANLSSSEGAAASEKAGAASVPMAWTPIQSGEWAHIGVSLKPTVAVGVTRRPTAPVVVP